MPKSSEDCVSRSDCISEDIVFPQRDVHVVPEQMEQQGVDLLHAVDRPARYDEAVPADIHHAAAVAAREADGQELALAARGEARD